MIDRFGFDAVPIGALRNGAALQPGQPIFGTHRSAQQLLDELARPDNLSTAVTAAALEQLH